MPAGGIPACLFSVAVLCAAVLAPARSAADGGRFTDVTATLGVAFEHRNGATEEKRLPETYGSGTALFDSDGDGDLDLYLVNGGSLLRGRRADESNRLYRNDGARFTDITAGAGAPGAAFGMGVAAADYDNDGDQDLYLTNWGPDALYRNEGEVRFGEVTHSSGLDNPQWGSSSTFLDYDRDGDLDLFVANYVDFRLDDHPWCGRRDLGLRMFCDPRKHEPTADLLYRNEGNGAFVDVSGAAGIIHRGNGLGAISGDFDGDGDADVYVTNDLMPNFYYVNSGQGTFEEIGLMTRTSMSADGLSQAGMGVDAGDYDNDGDLDLFVTNYQLENNNLFRNDGDYFSEVSFASGLGHRSLNYLGFGTGFLDFDNDGWLDLFVANGHVHDNIERYDPIVTHAQSAQLFRNRGDGTYEEWTAHAGDAFQGRYVGRGSAFGDFDGDGDTDIVVSSSGRSAALLRNDGGNERNHWLRVHLQGTQSSRDAVGAKLYLAAGGLQLYREVRAGSGYQSSSQRDPHFGVGAAAVIDSLLVVWPSGARSLLAGIAVDGVVRIEEPAR